MCEGWHCAVGVRNSPFPKLCFALCVMGNSYLKLYFITVADKIIKYNIMQKSGVLLILNNVLLDVIFYFGLFLT